MHSPTNFPSPTRGSSLLVSFRLHTRTVVILGSGKHAAMRAFACLESDAQVVLLTRGLNNACDEVRWRVDQGQIEWKNVEEEARRWCTTAASASHVPKAKDEDEAALHSVLSSLPSVSLVCITDTIIPSSSTGSPGDAQPRSFDSASRLHNIASRIYRIPTNTTDMPSLCDFTFPSVHRFCSVRTGQPSALQVGVTTNTKGCRLSSRITREIIAKLPQGVGDAVDNVGRLRDKAKASGISTTEASRIDDNNSPNLPSVLNEKQDQDSEVLPLSPNEPVPQNHVVPFSKGNRAQGSGDDETLLSRTQRRMRWVAQVSEYWPIESLAALDDQEIDRILSSNSDTLPRAIITRPSQNGSNSVAHTASTHSLPLGRLPPPPIRGRIFLLGSGPGHPSLLTLATSRILQSADLVLSDKLVPEAVLRIIPQHVELRIARKFPGNADRAQDELMYAALEAADQGKAVVRLKQGDPMLYARASSEIECFTAHGYPPTIVPGLSSALAAPLAARIPVTARGVAEGVAICTGVEKGGKGGRVPPYERGTTVLVLMGVARLAEVVRGMIGGGHPDYLPTCIIERGTMSDQRVVSSTLGGIVEAMSDSRVGPQRPPGMMVVGWACLGVEEGVEGVSTDTGEGLKDRDIARVDKWLRGERFVIKEGLEESWQDL